MKKRMVREYPMGRIGIAEEEGRITEICFIDRGQALQDAEPGETPLLREAAVQLAAYFKGTLRAFELPLAPQGTAFARRVWAELLQIPYGETRSYGQIAERIGAPQAARAVGSANHRNPIAIVIPCHRVIGADGRLTGYGGGLDKKEFLLALEQKFLFSFAPR